MGQIRGIKRIGPKPKFAPIIVKHEEKPPVVVATFLENHIRRGTVQRDDLYTGVKFGVPAAGSKHVHPAEDSGRRPAHSSRGRAWTDDEDTQIIVMVKGGHTIQEIADEIDRTWDATHKRITRLRKIYNLPYSTHKGRHRKEI